jgi:hypothetical protein
MKLIWLACAMSLGATLAAPSKGPEVVPYKPEPKKGHEVKFVEPKKEEKVGCLGKRFLKFYLTATEIR